jgi:phospholipase/carboxylesterase
MFDEAAGAIYRFIGALPLLYDADPRKIYFMGFSQGAAAAYATAMRNPGTIQGIAGLLGFVPVQSSAALETLALKEMPIFMAVGVDDPYISHERTKSCAQTLMASGALLDYREYETGHRLNAQGLRDLRAWWKALAARK